MWFPIIKPNVLLYLFKFFPSLGKSKKVAPWIYESENSNKMLSFPSTNHSFISLNKMLCFSSYQQVFHIWLHAALFCKANSCRKIGAIMKIEESIYSWKLVIDHSSISVIILSSIKIESRSQVMRLFKLS